MDQIFTSENKRKQVEFFTFFEVYVFFQWNILLVYGSIFDGTVTHSLQKSEELLLACLFQVSLGYGYPHPLFA